jgi:hypothetical protein
MTNIFWQRAVEKETVVENGEIKTKRIPENELFQRFSEYAKLKTLMGTAVAKQGLVSITNPDADNPDVDYVFGELRDWLKGKKRFFGETSLADVEYDTPGVNVLLITEYWKSHKTISSSIMC